MNKKSKAKSPDSVGADGSVRARVLVFPRAEILDPQGKAIAGALSRLGFGQIREVRAGKSYDLVLEGVEPGAATALLEQAARKLLANDVVEDFQIEILEGAAP